MDLTKLGLVFKFIIIGIIYIIIFFALRIMYKDIKNGGKKKPSRKKNLGLEVIGAPKNSNIKKGAVIPISTEITIGRRENNAIMLVDPYVSGRHAKIYVRNTECIIEDLGSTNGTLINNEKVEGKFILSIGDEIKIGEAEFRVIG